MQLKSSQLDLGRRRAVRRSRRQPACVSGPALLALRPCPWLGCGAAAGTFTLKKLECSRQAAHLNNAAWNNGIGPRFYFVGFSGPEVMIKRDSRGHSYCGVRGEILGSPQDERRRKHLPRMFSLIKNESQRFEDDQIPS